MSEEVKASFYLRFSDVLGEDPATAMQKIVDGGIKIDSDFVQTLQKQKKDAEEALKAAKLLAKVSGDSFVDAGLDISMKEEYEKAKKILDSTEQMWDSLKTDDVIPERTRGQAASPARPRSQSLEQQIMRETLGGSSNESAQARPPAGGNSAGVPMNLYDQMDALLGSISDGSFSSPSTPAPTGPSSASGAKPPPLRAPKRPQQLQDQQERPEQPAHVAPGPPPALAGRPALGAASARAAADEEDLSRAELESRAVELEEELFQGGAGDGLAEAEAVSMARERIQALRTGDANVGGGSGMSGGSLEDRFPDLADSDGVTMEALLNQKPEPRREEKPAEPQPPPQPPKALAARPKVRPPPPPEPQESGPKAVQSEPHAAPSDLPAAAPAATDPQRAAKQPPPPAARGQPPRLKPVAAAPSRKQAMKQPQPDAAAAPQAPAVPAVTAEAPELGAQQAAAPAARPAAPLAQARSDGGGSAAAMEAAIQRALTEPDKTPPRRRVPVTALPKKRRKARRTPAQQAEAVEQLAPPPPTAARRAQGAGFVPRQQRPNAAAADGAAVGAGVEGAPDASGTGEAEAAQQAAQSEAVPLIDRPTKPSKRAEMADQQSPEGTLQ